MYVNNIPLPRPTSFNSFRVTQQTIGQQIPAWMAKRINIFLNT